MNGFPKQEDLAYEEFSMTVEQVKLGDSKKKPPSLLLQGTGRVGMPNQQTAGMTGMRCASISRIVVQGKSEIQDRMLSIIEYEIR
jgi:hypothetical protein